MTDRDTNRSDLYLWQPEALSAWRSNDYRGVVEAVTGTGKTRVGIAAIEEAHRSGLKSLVLVPSVALMDQWVKAIKEMLPGIEVGRWGNGHYTALADCDVVVAVVNTALKHLREMRVVAGLLVADECHHYAAPKYRRALVDVSRRLGLTATFKRPDHGIRQVLEPYFDRVVYQVGYGRALKDGVVCEFEVDLVAVAFSSSASRRRYESLTAEMDQARATLISRFHYPADPASFMARVSKPPADWQSLPAKLCKAYMTAFNERRELLAAEPAKLQALRDLAPEIRTSGGCLVFTQTKSAAEQCARALRRAGIAAKAIHSGLTAAERRKRIKDFEDREVHALVAPQILDEGVDLPDADLGIIVASSRSKRQMIQRMGRILRLKPDGRSAKFIILYMEGTGEDPAMRAHEAFLDQVLPYARLRRSLSLAG